MQMIELHANERFIIERLLERGVFTSTVTSDMLKNEAEAIQTFKRPQTKKRITEYLYEVFGLVPNFYQDNLVFLPGFQYMGPDEVHVFLATLKTVINEPSLQFGDDARVVATQTVIRQVRSEVVDLSETMIFRLIRKLFVDRFKLFTPERLEGSTTDQDVVIEEYWSVNPDFTSFSQCVVDSLQTQQSAELNGRQQVIQALMERPFLSPKATPKEWSLLMRYKKEVAESLQPLLRFELEVGAEYALLLDRKRQRINSKPYTVALAVARSLEIGIPEEQLNHRIHEVNQRLFNNSNEVAIGLVREALFDNGLAIIMGHNVVPTAIADRFAVQIREDEEFEK